METKMKKIISIFMALCIVLSIITSCSHIHDYGEWTITKRPTCTEDGEQERYCSCGEKQTQVIPSTGHSFGEWKTIKNPTASEPGEEERVCECGERQVQSIPALQGEVTTDAPEQTTTPEVTTEPSHVHSFAAVWSKDTTQHWRDCSCGEKGDVAAHAFGEWIVTKAATETAQGEKKHSCSICGFEETEAIPVLAHIHSFSDNWSNDASQHWHVCACGEKNDVVAHSFGSWTVTKQATCTATGTQKHLCTLCGYEETATVAKKAHTTVVDAAVAPTCTKSGLTEGRHCSVCNTVITAQQVVPAKGHSMKWTVVRQPTCTGFGQEMGSCSACSFYYETRNIEPLGHDYVVSIVQPTATSVGYTEHKCSRCNEAYIDNIIQAGETTALDENEQAALVEDGITLLYPKNPQIISKTLGSDSVYCAVSITNIAHPNYTTYYGERVNMFRVTFRCQKIYDSQGDNHISDFTWRYRVKDCTTGEILTSHLKSSNDMAVGDFFVTEFVIDIKNNLFSGHTYQIDVFPFS